MKKLIVANWKSHKSPVQAAAWLAEYTPLVSGAQVDVVLVPAFPLLSSVQAHLTQLHSSLLLGMQDISPFPPGSYTGAVVAENVIGLGVKYVIVGHSERRRYFRETHQDVANKVDQVLEAGLTPIVCVDDDYVRLQAAAIPENHLSQCIVAYEPLASIGNGHNQPVSEVVPVVQRIRDVWGQVPVLYGGSVEPHNVGEYLAIVDGVLVGHASLEAQTFAAMVTAAAA